MCYVYTAGYEGKTIEQFLGLLTENHIHCVIDVREIPLSRKKGFSKKSLAVELAECGIEYVHISGLGSPKTIRDELHKSKDYDTFFNDYRFYIGNHFEYVQEAYEYTVEEKTCLLCFEKDYRECHRSIVADLLVKTMPDIDGVVNL